MQIDVAASEFQQVWNEKNKFLSLRTINKLFYVSLVVSGKKITSETSWASNGMGHLEFDMILWILMEKRNGVFVTKNLKRGRAEAYVVR